MPRIPKCKVLKVKTQPTEAGGGNQTIVTCYLAAKPEPGEDPAQRLTLLYSHGNAVDLGQMLFMWVWLCAAQRSAAQREPCCAA